MKIIKDQIKRMTDDSRRIYHTIEGSHEGYYFFAKTDNSHKFGFGSDGIEKGSVYKLDVWEGGNPVGRDSITGGHVSKDFVAGYYNKWELKPKTAEQKKIVKEIVKYLDSNLKEETAIPEIATAEIITPERVKELYETYENKGYFLQTFGTKKFHLVDAAFLERMYNFLSKKRRRV